MRHVLNTLNPRPGQNILDAGCGDGIYSVEMLKQRAKVFGVDISEKMVMEAKQKGIDAIVGDLSTIRLKRRFDKILCTGVLEFVKDEKDVIDNLLKHLKKDGVIVFLIPTDDVFGRLYRLYHSTHGIDVRIFPKKTLKGYLQERGIEVEQISKSSIISYVIKARLR
jgi:2-polyprenyl-3-methyl-5-hydroxy-6-metoxy-1,4-benzoquinol methylase